MGKAKKRALSKKRRKGTPPSLKSASGAGFSFEDKVAAYLFCEMLAGQSSLGPSWGPTERIERQANDWEPFGDLLLITKNSVGQSAKSGCSVKSNRQFNANGCSDELRDAFWAAASKPVFNEQTDCVGVFCAELSNEVSPVLNQLCRQAREEDRAERLDEKIKDAKHRKIYESFRHKTDTGPSGLPWHVLRCLVPREFDFENAASRSEQAAISLSREILDPSRANGDTPTDLWKELLDIARQLRDVGGSATRDSLRGRLRNKFLLRDDPSDSAAWQSIRALTQEWLEQIETTLPGGLNFPRTALAGELKNTLAAYRGCHVLGESGLGKSALVKTAAVNAVATARAEVVWIKSEQFARLLTKVPDFEQVLLRTKSSSGWLIFDALEACYEDGVFKRIAETIAALTANTNSRWKIVLICQTPDWSRVSRRLVREIAGHDALSKRVECGGLEPDDMKLASAASSSVRRLALQSRLQRILSSPKVLDLLLSAQLAEQIPIAGEADLIQWWWDEQVRQGQQFAEEEKVARNAAVKMAQALTTELSPDAIEGPATAVESLLNNRVLRRTRDGRLRFDHDLLADWSRVMHLRTLGDGLFAFMRANAENPPWLRSIRLLSQHLLEREADLDRWRSVIAASGTKGDPEKIPAHDLQVLDAWLEGIPYCSDARNVLKTLRAELLEQNGWLLRRLIRRLLRTATIPDPIVQERFQQMDAKSAEAAAKQIRWPLMFLWKPVVEFLVENSFRVTELIPVEMADIGVLWAHLNQHFQFDWKALAEVVVLNAEKELRREVAGDYRHYDDGIFAEGDRAGVHIYGAALSAASQFPDRVAKFALKAAGRSTWEQGDIGARADREWLGEYRDRSYLGDGTYVKDPIECWTDGPTRRISSDFFHAWFDAAAPVAFIRERPEIAREVTLALMIEWPKTAVMRGGHSTGIDRHGFRFDADNMYPAFWNKGPFLVFLRHNWRVALDLVIRLVNFATDRYEDWWPYDPGVSTLAFATPHREVKWKGNHQVYAWNRYHMNTPQAVTCALMALEKWLDEELAAKRQISEPVQILYRSGNSLAFAGVLVSLGKRYPDLFVSELKPLLFLRDVHMHDLRAVRESVGGGYWPRDGAFVNELRRQWETLPGRHTWLKQLCCEWVVTNPTLEPVLNEVATAWRNLAATLPNDSEEQKLLLRWAAHFDRSLWKVVTFPGGRQAWQNEPPEELRDDEGEELLARKQALLMWPHQCADMLQKRATLTDAQLEDIWQKLHNWGPFERIAEQSADNKEEAEFVEHRHARAGLLAVLLCLGRSWLAKTPQRRAETVEEIRKLLANEPRVSAYSAEENHDDCEGLLARAVVQCWAIEPANAEWRGIVAGFVTAYRYRTIRHVFDEAFQVRSELNDGYEALEAFALSYAVVRHKATRTMFLGMRHEVNGEEIRNWCDEWIPKFADGNGPAWALDWSQIEATAPFRPKSDNSHGMQPKRYEYHRRDYGLDMGVVVAAFGHLPPLAAASDEIERRRWLHIAEQMMAAFCRTLPKEEAGERDEWKYEPWGRDEKIFEVTAARIFECSAEERRRLWRPILDLPPHAHHHITSFLSAIWIESVRTEPIRLDELNEVWREMAEYLGQSIKWSNSHSRAINDVWKTVLLYDNVVSGDEEMYGPLVDALRPYYEAHAKRLSHDVHEQSSLAAFLKTKAGNRVLIDALCWFREDWQTASSYFWDTVVERGHFARLLEHAWREKRGEIRSNSDAFAAFKTLTLNLAAHHVPAALAVQDELGSEPQ
jgi:hypothetical protein